MRLSVGFAPWCGGVRTTWGLGAWRLFGWIRRGSFEALRIGEGTAVRTGGIGRGRARRDELVFNLLMLSGVVPHNREILIINARFLHYKTVIIL